MRIAIVTKGFAQSNNDWSLPPLIDFVRSISGTVDVDIYAIYYPFETRDYHIFGGRVLSFGLGRYGRLRKRMGLGTVENRLIAEHQKTPYDLVHAIWADTPGQVAARAAKRLDLPLITTLYAGEAVWIGQIGYGAHKGAMNKGRLSHVLRQSNAVTCGSDSLAKRLGGRDGPTPQTIPFGLDPALFSPTGPAVTLKGKTRILTAASLTPVKGLDIILGALRNLADQSPALLDGVHWHLVGPDAHSRGTRNALTQQIGALPVTLHEAQPHWEMPQWYRGADLVVQGSWFESQCFAAMEPAACGTPVIGTSVGILPQMVSQDWRCEPGSVDAMQNLLKTTLENRAGWAGEAENQRAWVLGNATLDTAREAFLALYARVAAVRVSVR